MCKASGSLNCYYFYLVIVRIIYCLFDLFIVRILLLRHVGRSVFCNLQSKEVQNVMVFVAYC